MSDTKSFLRIEMFGGLRVRQEGGTPVEYPAQQSGVLLALLALDLRRNFTREELVERLWSEDDTDSARKKLRHALYMLRRQFEPMPFDGEDILRTTRTTVSLNPNSVRTDVATFEAALRAATRTPDRAERTRLLDQAVRLYRGPLLPGFYQNDILEARERMAALYGSALLALTQAHEQAGDLDRAIETARRAVAQDPLMEEAHIALMRLHAALGQPSGVLKQFQEWKRILKEELAEEPSSETQRLMETLRQQAQVAAHGNGISSEDATSPGNEIFGLAAPPPSGSFVSPPHTLSASRSRPAAPRRRLPLAWIAAGVLLLLPLGWRFAEHHTLPVRPSSPPASHSSSGKALWVARYAPAPDEVDGGQPETMTVDEAGNIYIAGSVHTKENDADFLTLKYDPDGHLLWHQRYNGPGNGVDRATCIAVDRKGNVYVAGESDSGRGNGLTTRAGVDIVVLKYDPNGDQRWVTRYNGPDDGEDHPTKLCVDPQGEAVFVAGVSFATRHIEGRAEPHDEWVTLRYNGSDGQKRWIRSERGTSANADAGAEDMVVDAAANVYVTGCYQVARHSALDWDCMTVKYAANGKVLWKRTFNDPHNGDDVARKMAMDASGNLYVTAEADTGNPTEGGRRDDIATIKYDNDGNEKWIRFYDFKGLRDLPRGLAVDATGNIAIAGKTGIGAGSSWDYLTLRYDANGNHQWVNNYNGRGGYGDYIEDVAFDSRGNVVFTGRVFDSKPILRGGKGADYDTLKYAPDGHRLWEARYDSAGLDDLVSAIAVDRRDNVIVTGMSNNGNNTSSIATIKYAP